MSLPRISRYGSFFYINFEDLKEDVQKELLEFMNVESPADMNWDVLPITSIPNGDQDIADE